MTNILRYIPCLLLTLALASCQSKGTPEATTYAVSPGPVSATTPAQATSPSSAGATASATPTVEVSPVAQHEPAKGPWSVMYKVTRNGGKSYHSGGWVKVADDGALEHASWQSGIAGSEPSIKKGTLAPEAVAVVGSALADPGLENLPEGEGPVELTWTVNGQTMTVRTTSETFPGAAGRLVQALGKAAPPLPAVRTNGPM